MRYTASVGCAGFLFAGPLHSTAAFSSPLRDSTLTTDFKLELVKVILKKTDQFCCDFSSPPALVIQVRPPALFQLDVHGQGYRCQDYDDALILLQICTLGRGGLLKAKPWWAHPMREVPVL